MRYAAIRIDNLVGGRIRSKVSWFILLEVAGLLLLIIEINLVEVLRSWLQLIKSDIAGKLFRVFVIILAHGWSCMLLLEYWSFIDIRRLILVILI